MKPHGDDGRGTGRLFLLIFVVFATGVIASGVVVYRNYERSYRAEVDRQLSAVAELKVRELAQWRRERLGDGRIFFRNEAFSGAVRRFSEAPEDADARRHLQAWVHGVLQSGHYDGARLLSPRGATLFSIPSGLPPASGIVTNRIPEVLNAGQVTIQDFYRSDRDAQPYLSLMVPVLDPGSGSQPLGVLVLRVDPESYLYPYLKRWPTPSLTAETLLVRREGSETVFLNELRFQTNTALRLRMPLDRPLLPAALAVLGREGVIDGTDYRGVPVVAALRTVPDSPWFLVARMDADEVYRPLRERLWIVIAMVALLLFGAGTGVGLAWRQQRARFYREQYELAEASRASELRYRRLFESAKDGILILDAGTGTIVDANPFLIGLLGYAREAFLGKKVWELGFFRDIVANEEKFAELQAQEYVRYDDLPLETADGRRIDVEFVSNVYLVSRSKVIQCNIRDISARKQAHEALIQSEKRFRSLAVSTSQIIWNTDGQGQVCGPMPSFQEYTGQSEEEIRGSGWVSALHPDDVGRTTAVWQDAVRTRTGYRTEYRLRRHDGVYRHFTARGAPVVADDGRIVEWIGTCTDITDRKEAEAALEERSAELQERNVELERFLYTASHDLKSPVVTIRTFLDYLEQDVSAAKAERIAKDMQFIRAAADKMARLLDEILELSRIGRVVGPPVRVPFRALVDEALAAVAGNVAARGVRTKVDDRGVTLRGDRLRLAAIWQNLVENAVKFMGGQAEPCIEIGVEPRNDETVFFVRDNGIGIDPRFHAKVFGLFERLDPKSDGTGIGLTIVKRIVEIYGGRLWLESAGPGQGACFLFTLPGAIDNPKEGRPR